jgi:hypothetical protein
MVDGLHLFIRNRTKKSFAIVLSGVGKVLRERDERNDLTNTKYEHIWNFHYESPMYNVYMPIKKVKMI